MDKTIPTRELIKEISAEMIGKIKEMSAKAEAVLKRKPKMVIISIDPEVPSLIYIRRKMEQCQKVGITCESINFTNEDSEAIIAEKITACSKNETVDGIIIQLPIPHKFNKYRLIGCIDAEKDIDGLTQVQQGRIALGLTTKLSQIPPTAQGVVYLAEYICGDITSKKVLNIGSSSLVGMPSAIMLSHKKATTTIANSKTLDLKKLCLESDIIISATGKAGLIMPDMLRKDSVVIDVGINQIQNDSKMGGDYQEKGKREITGDVNFSECVKVTPYITPVPGGVGIFTIVFLLRNVIISCLLLKKDDNKVSQKKWEEIESILDAPIFNPIMARKNSY